MKISSRGRYGIRFLLDLALHAGNGAVSLRDVAGRQGISEKYLWQVVAPLKAAGVVAAVRGSRGGFRLARAPRAVTVRKALEALEGAAFGGGAAEEPAARDRAAAHVLRDLWQSLDRAVIRAADEITLEDLMEQHRRQQRGFALTYEI